MEVDCSNKRSRVHHKCYKNTVPGRWYITSATRTPYLGAGTSQVLQEHRTWALVHHKCYKNTVPGRWYITSATRTPYLGAGTSQVLQEHRTWALVHHKCYKNTVPGRWYITSATRTPYLGAGTSQVLQEHCTRPLVHHKCYKNTVPGRWYITSATRTLYLIPIKEYMSNFKVKKYTDPNKIVVRATVANDCIVRIELTTLDSCNIYQLYRLFEKQGLN